MIQPSAFSYHMATERITHANPTVSWDCGIGKVVAANTGEVRVRVCVCAGELNACWGLLWHKVRAGINQPPLRSLHFPL